MEADATNMKILRAIFNFFEPLLSVILFVLLIPLILLLPEDEQEKKFMAKRSWMHKRHFNYHGE